MNEQLVMIKIIMFGSISKLELILPGSYEVMQF